MAEETARWILGLGGSDHDFSAALACGGDINLAVEQERLSRRKHGISYWYENPVKAAVSYCIDAVGINLDQVEKFVSSDLIPKRVRDDLRDRALHLFPHHLCHAASVYMMLPPGTRAGVIVYDGFGSVVGVSADPTRNSRETFSFYRFEKAGYSRIGGTAGTSIIEQDDFPTCVTNSIGMLYELVTGLLGFSPMESGKTMGLASHGVPRYLPTLKEFSSIGNNPDACFECPIDNPELVEAIEQILLLGRSSFQVKADIAASVQALINEVLLHCASFFDNMALDCLCVSGGCGLNTVANAYLAERASRPIVIPPHCGDSGLCFGAIWLEAFEQQGVSPTLTFRGQPLNPHVSRPGRNYTADERRTAVQAFYPRLIRDASVFNAGTLASVLAQGAVVGVLNGASEIGPRALGGRSIFADPRSAMMRERINRLIKGREPFRPLAPIILRSQYSNYFEDEKCADPYMLKVARARKHCLEQAPAVVHVDGTARVQVVDDENGDPFLVELLSSFFAETGVAVLINTSFNRKGEPIVETPLDAIDAFLGVSLDGLYLDGEFYRPLTLISPKP
jgi:carbamoyltransferase